MGFGVETSAKKEKSVSRDEPFDGETVNMPTIGGLFTKTVT